MVSALKDLVGGLVKDLMGPQASGSQDTGLQIGLFVDGGFNHTSHGSRGAFLARTLGVDGGFNSAHNVSGSAHDSHGADVS